MVPLNASNFLMWKKLRTANLLERDLREVRRRTRPMGVFPHGESAQRILYGVTRNLHQIVRQARYKMGTTPSLQSQQRS